jgi:hypothetical protein
MRTVPALATLIALIACTTAVAQSPSQPGDIDVALETADQSRLGVSTTRLESVQAPDIIEAIGRVLDVSALAQLDAEIETVAAVAAASASDTRRLLVLAEDDENVSRQVLEAAQARSAGDSARLRLARQRLGLEWGTGMAALEELQRRQIIEEIAGGHAALLRIDPLEPRSMIGASVQLRPDANAPSIAAESLGPAAIADAQMQTNGLLVAVRGDAATDLRPGRVLAAEIVSTQTQAGVILPRSALVRIDGSTWAYLRRGKDRFIRREVIAPRMQNDGWFVSAGFTPADEIVDQGAGSLLAVERSGEAVDDD